MSSKAPKSKATIMDIAKVSGVSKSTVSLVLNNSELVKPETAENVRKVAAQLGYIYNRSAANLRQGVSNIIGVVVNDLTNTFFVELLIGAERKLLESNFTTLLAHTAEDHALQQQVIVTMREHKIAGLIICPTFDTSPELISMLKKWGCLLLW
ncbi:LacI family DNA-binding transcriptional regulator [Acinetobacter bereziniae]|nr:LacI family DNA-binding transcriptional regulator [Acinetobacter bereziniae]